MEKENTDLKSRRPLEIELLFISFLIFTFFFSWVWRHYSNRKLDIKQTVTLAEIHSAKELLLCECRGKIGSCNE